MQKKDDIIYIVQVLAGNINAYSHLVERHKDKVFNLAFRISGSREEAEEIAQDSFLKAYRSLKSFKMKSSFATWLYRIVYNTSISYVRLKRKGILSLEDLPADTIDFIGSGCSEEEAEIEFRKTLVNFALQKVSEEDRALITLYYFEEMSIDEIFEATGINKSNIKVKLFRARQKMLEILEKSEMKKILCYE